MINGEQAIRMPPKGKNILQFQNHHMQMPVPFVIYADFDAFTEKVTGCEPCGDKSYKVVGCYNDNYTKPVKIYRGEDSINKFMQQMLLEVQYCQKIISTKFKKPLNMTNEEEQEFETAVECHISLSIRPS